MHVPGLTHYNHYMFPAANSVIYSNDFQLLPCFLFGSSKVHLTLLKMMFPFPKVGHVFFSEGIPTKRLVFDKTFISSQMLFMSVLFTHKFTSKKYPNVGFYTIHDGSMDAMGPINQLPKTRHLGNPVARPCHCHPWGPLTQMRGSSSAPNLTFQRFDPTRTKMNLKLGI